MLWLEGPLDTAPAGDSANWSIASPFNTEIIKDKMFGRGVADARLAIAMFSVLAREIANDPLFKGTLFLAFDADEQSGRFTGIKEIIKQGPSPDGVILGYQSSDEISIGARGVLRLWLHVFGKSAHSGSRNAEGVNAISIMAKALAVLENLLTVGVSEDYFPFGSTLQPTLIKGGDAVNKVPDCCSVFLDIRLIPGMKKYQALKQVRDTLKEITAFQGNCSFDIEEVQYYPAFLTPPDTKLVQILKNEVLAVTGNELPLAASGPSSVGCLLANMAPVINCYGVSSGNAHADDEWILLPDVPLVYQSLYRTIINFCKG